MKEIQADNRWKWLEEKEFPRLQGLKSSEIELLILQLSSNKAVAYGLSNTFFLPLKKKRKKTPLKLLLIT